MIKEPRTQVILGHRALDAEIAEWRSWWSELSEFGEPRIDEMGSRLERFRGHLADHFASEETGVFASLRKRGYAAATTRLQAEHRSLLSGLDVLIERFHSCSPRICCWGEARREFEAFLNQLLDHEQRENMLERRLLGASSGARR